MTRISRAINSAPSAGGSLRNYTLFTPGPTDIPDEILNAMAQPLVYHREQSFAALLADITDKLKKILATNGKVYYFTASGTGAMEAACCNILKSTDRPIVAICGRFGQRWLEICHAYRIEPVVLQEEYGRSIPPAAIDKALKQSGKPTAVFTTLTETSTGALNDIKTFGSIIRQYDSYLVVDGIAGIGADMCDQDEWHVDAIVGASQKALMAPPGISFIGANERIWKKMRESDLPKYYFNTGISDKFLEKKQLPWTPAINVFYGLNQGLDMLLAIGIDENLKKHAGMASYVRDRVTGMGLKLLPDHPSNALTVAIMPDRIDSTEVIKEIKEHHKILFADGQADLRGKIIRVGHMGNYSIPKLTHALDVLEDVIKQRRG